MLKKVSSITSCYLGPRISPEHFIAEHFFLFLAKGTIDGYDGHRHYVLKSGESCIVRKNHLARYHKLKENDEFEKMVVMFDEEFLRTFLEKHPIALTMYASDDAFVRINKSELVNGFIKSLEPYYNKEGAISKEFADLKREELLLILLQTNPELKGILFDFGTPYKIDLKSYMNRNFRFNVAIKRFAFLTGRSLTIFKQDFKKIFQDTPSQWLIKKRLQEAYFLMDKEGQKASEVYLEVGFEDLSHFSFAFKKLFGFPPTRLRNSQRETGSGSQS